jgi:formylglycine-generating enzyme required for sulfatase activity
MSKYTLLLLLALSACTVNTEPLSKPGPAGSRGATGPMGEVGPTGPAGATGTMGTPGATGPMGTQGPMGPAGAVGPTGPMGLPGSLSPVPSCPLGYAQVDASPPVVCENNNGAGPDAVVQVGVGRTAFWIDRYEATLVDASENPIADPSMLGGNFPQSGEWTTPTLGYHAESRTGVGTPTSNITWFQAREACRASGKRLPTRDEWQTAARGTVKSSGDQNGSLCNTAGSGPRNGGGGSQCVSGWGAEDMIGNLAEWTDEWYAGLGNSTQTTTPWPAAYGGDGTSNIASSADVGTSPNVLTVGVPAAAIRGGFWGNGTASGVFSLILFDGPASWFNDVGFRCVIPQ